MEHRKGQPVRAETTPEKPEVRRNLMQGITDYVRDVRIEMTKVSWPTAAELRESTMVVIVMVAIMMVFIFIVDRGLTYAFEALVRLVG
jgi:preprotein translocase subunit SecE